MLIEWKNKDIKRSTILTPGWYHLKVEGYTEKLAKSQKSTNGLVEFVVVRNVDTGDEEECSDVPVFFNFNSGAPGFMVNFANALAESEDEEVTPGGRFQLTEAAIMGKEVEAFIGNRTQENGSVQNDVSAMFRKVGAAG